MKWGYEGRRRHEDRGAEGVGRERGSQKKNRFWISNRRILVQTGCFLYSSPKAVFAFLGTPFPLSKLKITLRTPFPGVPAGNDPCGKVKTTLTAARK